MFSDIDGVKVHYLDTGGVNPVLLLLHGWGCRGGTYQEIIGSLSSRFRIIAPDLPGFGDSPEPSEAWGVGDYAALIKAFCEKLNLHNITFFGHSLGCRIIIKLLADGRAESSVPQGKVVLTGAAGIKSRKSLPRKIKTCVFKTGKLFLKPFPRLFLKLQNRSGSADYRAASPMMRSCLVKIVNEDLTPLLPGVDREVLLIWGENDDQTPLSDGLLMERKMPNAGLAVIKNAGHYAFFDQPEQFGRILDSYLGDKTL
ncbi:MAG: alpha/beta hydrolase [Oscillospiraceae bacterium]|nr:alpha/beta hydrolase [Oscillospiraceae bacterium]